MKAAVIHQYGSPEVFQLEEVAQPTPKPDQVLIKVQATSVNPVDWKIRQGMLRWLPGMQLPLILGFDVAGTIEAVGDRVTRFRPGDPVFASLDQPSGGAYAEYAVAAETVVCVQPATLSHAEAASVPLAGLTALQALRDQGQLQAGQKVLINGASGGVGHLAVQIAKAMGAEVTGVCSGKNVAWVHDLGCDRVIDYTQQNFTQTAQTYDLIFDTVATSSLADCKAVLKPQGIYISTLPLPRTLFETILTWFSPGQRARLIMMQPKSTDLADLKDLIVQGQLHPVLDRTYRLNEIAAAHAYSQSGHAAGKIVIQVAD